jgi:hypothetical protein
MKLKRDSSLKASGNDSSLGAKSNKLWLVARRCCARVISPNNQDLIYSFVDW